MKNFGVSTHVSDQDYLPDDESSSDDCGGATVAKDNELKTGKSKSSGRNPDNEFVFDKEWAFRRKCSLQSLLSARLLTSSYEPKTCKKLELGSRHLTVIGAASGAQRRPAHPVTQVNLAKDLIVSAKARKKQNDTSECKSHTNESLKSRHRSNTVS